jgi:predicted Fe-Mo cluster-binding NifX family protein
MKIMMPLAAGLLTPHFGHCEEFALLELDRESGEIKTSARLIPPAHEPGVLPRWIAEQQANLVIAGGMGQRARGLLEAQGIEVVTGAPNLSPEQVVEFWQGGKLPGDENFCDH